MLLISRPTTHESTLCRRLSADMLQSMCQIRWNQGNLRMATCAVTDEAFCHMVLGGPWWKSIKKFALQLSKQDFYSFKLCHRTSWICNHQPLKYTSQQPIWSCYISVSLCFILIQRVNFGLTTKTTFLTWSLLLQTLLLPHLNPPHSVLQSIWSLPYFTKLSMNSTPLPLRSNIHFAAYYILTLIIFSQMCCHPPHY